MTRVEIVIDELVMRGLSPEQARVAAASIESRLVELADTGATVRSRDEASRRLPDVTATPGSLGDSVAGAVWSGLAGDGR
jgi:hypothetical protein